MSLADLRDLVIVIFGVLGILNLLVALFVTMMLARKAARALDSFHSLAEDVRGITSSVSGLMKPIFGAVAVVAGARRALDALGGGSRKKEGRKDE